MATEDETTGVIKSADRLFQIVEALKELGGVSVTELADHLDLAPSTTHRYLKTLHRHGYVDKKDGEYHLGLKFLDIGGYVRYSKPVRRDIKPTVKELARETDEAASFIMEHRGLGVFVYRETSESGVNTEVRIGKRSALHLSAGGKAILANLPEDRVEEILNTHGLTPKTDHSITDREELLAELEEIQQRGYALARSEHTDGVNAVGAPVRLPDGTLLGAMTVVGPAFRMRDERLTEEIPPLLLGKINEFVLNFSHS